MKLAPRMRFLMIRPLSGGVAPKAASRARAEAVAWAIGQTPQTRWVIKTASRGSLPVRMISIPRKRVPMLRAPITRPSSTSTSTLRWPSILVTGSILIVVDILAPFHS